MLIRLGKKMFTTPINSVQKIIERIGNIAQPFAAWVNKWTNTGYFILAFGLYTILYLWIFDRIGETAGSLVTIPVVLLAWKLGLRPGIIASLAAFPINTILFNISGLPGWDVLIRTHGAFPMAMLIPISAVIGYASKLNLRLKREIANRKVVDDELRKAAQKQSLHMQQSPLAFIEWNLDSEVTAWNKAAEVIFGYPEKEALGLNATELLFTEDVATNLDDNWQALLAKEGGRYSLNDNITKDGRRITCEWFNTQLTDENGEVVGLASLVQDITGRKRVEETLQSSEELYRRMTENAIVGIGISDMNENFEFVNPAFAEMLGYTQDEMIGMNLSHFTSEDEYEKYKAYTTRRVQGLHDKYEAKLRCKDGTVKDVHVSASTLTGPDGSHRATLAVILEITEQKRAEQDLKESERKYRQIIEEANDTVYTIDIDGAITYVNPPVVKLTGYPEEKIIGMQFTELIRADWVEPTIEFYRKQIKNRIRETTFEFPIITASGDEKWVEQTITLLNKDQEVSGLQGIVRDITERKQAEEAREVLIKQLEAKNAELENYSYTISHDLKSPLFTIKILTGLLENEVSKKQVGDQAQAAIMQINSSVDKMRLLMDDLLELSRVGRSVNPQDKLSLTRITQDAVSLLSGQIEERKVQVEIDPDLPTTIVDRVRMQQVMQNLIENAIKFMGDEPKPLIEVGCREGEEGEIIFVRDNGVGLDLKYSNKIFSLFQQLDPSREGTGIGLALVNRIIQLHGGRIWVESDGPGQGSSFCFTLPGTIQN